MTNYVFSLFHFIKSFLTVFYFINSLFKRKIVWKSTQVRIKIIKICYFSFTFKLNEKKKVPLKKTWLIERVIRTFCCWEGWCLTRGWKLFKKEAWQESSGENRREGMNYILWKYYILFTYQLVFILGIIFFTLWLMC